MPPVRLSCAPTTIFRAFDKQSKVCRLIQVVKILRGATTAGVPEPVTRAMMIAGFDLVRGATRRRLTNVAMV